MMALLIIFRTSVLHQLSSGGLCQERVTPCTHSVLYLYYLLSREKHLIFSKRVLKNWGRGRGEYLWIHFDEKWFWGVLLRKTAKKFDGLNPEVVRVYSKSYISNTMGISVVVVDFEYCL